MVCDQQFLANQMGVSTRTIRRWLDYLEEKGALVRIPVAEGLWNKDGEIKRRIMAMFSEKSGQEQ